MYYLFIIYFIREEGSAIQKIPARAKVLYLQSDNFEKQLKNSFTLVLIKNIFTIF